MSISNLFEKAKKYWWKIFLLALGPLILGFVTLFLWQHNGAGSPWFDVQEWPQVESSSDGNAPKTKIIGDDRNSVAVLRLLLFATSFLVFFNTLVYFCDVHFAVEQANANDNGLILRRRCTIFALITLIATIFWPFTIIFFPQWLVGKEHEYAILGLFISFGVIDATLCKNWRKLQTDRESKAKDCSQKIEALPKSADKNDANIKKLHEDYTKNNNEAMEFQINADYFKNQFWFVDVPVFVGISLVIGFQMGLLDEAKPKIEPTFAFHKGFAAGSLVMHLVLSQVIFIIVSAKYLLRMQTLENGQTTGG
jgi:hypothetical protein